MSRGARDPRQPVTVKWDPTTFLLSFIGSGDDLPIAGFGLQSTTSPFINVRASGAVGDGVTDDTTTVQAAIDIVAAAGGGVVYFPPGTYLVTGLNGANGVSLLGAGLDASVIQGTDAAGSIIAYTPSSFSTVALNSNVVLGSFSAALTGGGGANFSAGAWVYLNDAVTGNGSFITRVRTVVTDTLTLQDGSPFLFTAASTGTAGYLASGLWEGVVIRDLTVRLASGAATRDYCIRLNRCSGAVVQRVRVENALTAGIQLDQCYQATIRDCEAMSVQSASGSGVNSSQSTATIIDNLLTYNSAFGVGLTGEAYSRVVKSRLGGRASTSVRGANILHCVHFVFQGNTVSDWGATGVYIQDSRRCVVSGNTFMNIGDGTGDVAIHSGGSIAGQAARNTITGNNVYNCAGYGIALDDNGAATETFNVVSGNTISLTGNVGIYVVSSRNSITGNILEGYTNDGIFCEASTTTNHISGNTFRNGGSGNAVDTASSAGGNAIHDNSIFTESNNLHATDAQTLSNNLGGDVSMTSANTFYDGPTISVPAGTWHLTGTVTIRAVSLGFFTAKLWDGSSAPVAQAEQHTPTNGAVIQLSVSAIVSPTSTTTYEISAAATSVSNGANTLKAAPVDNGNGNTASHLRAHRVYT